MAIRAGAAVLAALLALEFGYRGFLRAHCLGASGAPAAYDVYGVGESTMQGQPWYFAAPPALVARALPGPTRVFNWARGGNSLYPQAYGFADGVMCRDARRPGAVLLYSGNNEFDMTPSAPLEGLRLALEDRSAVLRRVFFLLERRVPALRLRTPRSYRRNLERVVEAARAAGLTPVLSTVASNASVDPADGPAYALFLKGDRAAAREADPGHNFGRAKAAQNDIVRAVAREKGVALVDAAAFMSDDLFEDGHHPTVKGMVRLAQAYARALRPDAPVIAEPAPSKKDVVLAMLTTGRWFFSVAARHPRPQLRLKLARSKFERALAAEPANRSAKFGLCLVAAAEKGDLLRDEKSLDWLGERGFFYGEEYTFTDEDIRRAGCPGL